MIRGRHGVRAVAGSVWAGCRHLGGEILLTLGAVKLITHALAEATLAASPVSAAMRDPSWIGIQKLLIISQFDGHANGKLTADGLCHMVQSIASSAAPIPVSCTAIGDPALRSARTAVVAVQAAEADAGSGRKLMLLTIRRADEGGLEPAPVYFGSMLRAVALDSGDMAQLDQAIGASLRQILPWLNQSTTSLQPE